MVAVGKNVVELLFPVRGNSERTLIVLLTNEKNEFRCFYFTQFRIARQIYLIFLSFDSNERLILVSSSVVSVITG